MLPDDGTPALVAPAIPLPGGLTGISGSGGELAVTATPQLVGRPTVSLKNLLSANGAGLTMPIDVLVSTPSGALGPDCTIGDKATPITLNLTTGTTSPPPPNTPITGAVGTAVSSSKGLITDTGLTLVDNAFAVPGADNCGTDGVLDEVLDLDKGLPSAAGSNTAILAGSSYLAPASLIVQVLKLTALHSPRAAVARLRTEGSHSPAAGSVSAWRSRSASATRGARVTDGALCNSRMRSRASIAGPRDQKRPAR